MRQFGKVACPLYPWKVLAGFNGEYLDVKPDPGKFLVALSIRGSFQEFLNSELMIGNKWEIDLMECWAENRLQEV
jgi:hypothetical protein